MSALSVRIVTEFCQLCDWAYEVWTAHRCLFNDNRSAASLQKSAEGDALGRLNIISQEYVLLQIAKLHDPAVQGGQVNLTIKYIIDFGGWDEPIRKTLDGLHQHLLGLTQKIRPARHKVLSHNDLLTILDSAPLGEFEPGADIQYFKTLQEFVNVVHGRLVGGPYPFNDLAHNDAVALIAALTKRKRGLPPT